MKHIYIIILLFSIPVCRLFSQVKNLQLGDKIINLSERCQKGHVTAFIFSTYGCEPCEKLKKELLNRYGRNDKFDIYYCLIGEMNDYKNWNVFKDNPVPKYWANIERIYDFPTIYIYSPEGNLLAKYRDIDKSKLEEINKKIDFLLNNLDYYYSAISNSGSNSTSILDTLEQENDTLVLNNIDTLSPKKNNKKKHHKKHHSKKVTSTVTSVK